MTPWLFAGLAVAYVVWSGRRTAPASLPPLSPIPSPLAPAASPAAASGGPHPLTLAAILLAGGMVAFAIRETRTSPPAPSPDPTPAVGLDLRGKFVGEQAADDAAITATLLEELADVIAWDGQQAEPRLRSGAALADLRVAAREYRTRGVSLGQRQPLARDAIKAFLDQEVGTDGGPIDAAARSRWVTAFRAVAAAAKAAIGR